MWELVHQWLVINCMMKPLIKQHLSDALKSKGAKGAIRRLFGREAEVAEIPLRHLRRPVSARIEDLDDDSDDDRGL